MWGDKIEFLQGMAAKATTIAAIPQCLQNRPVLNTYQQFYWNAFIELFCSRTYTFSGVAEIPYSEKIFWMNENDIEDPVERKTFMQIIHALDNFYVKEMRKKTDK